MRWNIVLRSRKRNKKMECENVGECVCREEEREKMGRSLPQLPPLIA